MDAYCISDSVRIALTQPGCAIPEHLIAPYAKAWADQLDIQIIEGIIARNETHRLQPVPLVEGKR